MANEALSAAKHSEGFVIEIGPGTGCITCVLLEQGIAAERLVCVEIDPALHQYMIERFPEVQTILGDAADLDTILPERCSEIAVVVSSVPLKNLPLGKEKEIIKACCAILKPHGKFVQFTASFRMVFYKSIVRTTHEFNLMLIRHIVDLDTAYISAIMRG